MMWESHFCHQLCRDSFAGSPGFVFIALAVLYAGDGDPRVAAFFQAVQEAASDHSAYAGAADSQLVSGFSGRHPRHVGHGCVYGNDQAHASMDGVVVEVC